MSIGYTAPCFSSGESRYDEGLRKDREQRAKAEKQAKADAMAAIDHALYHAAAGGECLLLSNEDRGSTWLPLVPHRRTQECEMVAAFFARWCVEEDLPPYQVEEGWYEQVCLFATGETTGMPGPRKDRIVRSLRDYRESEK